MLSEDLTQIELFQRLSLEEQQLFFQYLKAQRYPAGCLLLQEGSTQRDMFFLLQGEVCVTRSGLQLGLLRPGAHAGELGLISGRPCSASVHTLSATEVVWLTYDDYQRLKTLSPEFALKLQDTLILQLGLQLTDISDRFGQLLQERSLPRNLMVNVQLGQEQQALPTGTPVGACLPQEIEGQQVVAALSNFKLVSLDTPLVSDVELQPLTASHWEGERVLRHSGALLLLEAAHQLKPGLRLTMALSVGGTQWIQANNSHPEDWEALAQSLTPLLLQMIAGQIPFRHELWSLEEAMHFFEASGRLEVLELLKASAEDKVMLASCGEFYVLSDSLLVPHTGYLKALRIRAVENGLVLTTKEQGPSIQALEAYAAAIKGHNHWLKSMGVHSVGHLNRLAIQGQTARLIQVAEGFHEKRIGQIADQISKHQSKIRIVCIAGPSSSGKTTFIQRLSIQLIVNGYNPVALSLDDYYLNRELAPRDAQGELDFEHLEALNLALLSEHLRRLLAGEQVATARYDFHRGLSEPEAGSVLQLGPHDVLLLEGIHGLNPALFAPNTDFSRIFRIFVQPMSSLAIDEHARINPSDLRLLRRIIRDRYQRATLAADNILRWPSVRAGEQRWIFPFVDHADEIFDTSLVYELAVLKVYAERYLLEVPRQHPAYATAHRLHQLVQFFVAIYPDYVPQNSILQEFIG